MAYRSEDLNLVTLDEAVRGRPNMFFGAERTDPALPGLILRMVVDDAVDDSPSMVRIEIHDGLRFIVTDDGPGMPLTAPDGRAWPPIALTTLPAGSKFRGTGLAAVRAVSADLVIDIHSEGQHYRCGGEEMNALGLSDREGTVVSVLLDSGYFGSATLPLDIRSCVRETPGVMIDVVDLR